MARRARMVEAARRMKAACSAASSLLLVSSMCTSSGTNPWRTIKRLLSNPVDGVSLKLAFLLVKKGL